MPTQREITELILRACRPCNLCPEGSGSGSGIPMPNGCGGCLCCPCICWWATTWHKSITKDSFLGGPYTDPSFPWILTANNLVNVGGDPDYMYAGDLGSEEDFCTIGGVYPIDDNGDIIALTDPIDPRFPQWEGTLEYTHSGTSEVVTITVKFRLLWAFTWQCDWTYVDSWVWFGTDIIGASGAYLTDGQQLTGGANPGFLNKPIIPNDIVGAGVGVYPCEGAPVGPINNGNMPIPNLVALYDPDCVVP